VTAISLGAALPRFAGVANVTSEVNHGAGHLMTLEVPDLVASSTNAFLTS
jgi:hypothetical protein